MEKIKKTILQALTTGTTVNSSGQTVTIIIPDSSAVYYMKIGLKQDTRDIGFFDIYQGADAPPEGEYYVDYDDNIFIDSNNDRFII